MTLSYDSVIVCLVTNEATWTLEQLGERVKDALATGYVPPGSARVRAVPDARTIRYYSTLGIVDRPELQGRTALYGERHLLQLVAIKRLQADGLALTQVQERLGGLDTEGLRELARVEVDALVKPVASPSSSVEKTAPEADAPRGRRDFWRQVPVVAPEPTSTSSVTEEDDAASHSAPQVLARGRAMDHIVPDVSELSALFAVELAPGVTLVLRDGRRPDPDDVQALRHAAEAVLAAIEARGLLPGPRERSGP